MALSCIEGRLYSVNICNHVWKSPRLWTLRITPTGLFNARLGDSGHITEKLPFVISRTSLLLQLSTA